MPPTTGGGGGGGERQSNHSRTRSRSPPAEAQRPSSWTARLASFRERLYPRSRRERQSQTTHHPANQEMGQAQTTQSELDPPTENQIEEVASIEPHLLVVEVDVNLPRSVQAEALTSLVAAATDNTDVPHQTNAYSTAGMCPLCLAPHDLDPQWAVTAAPCGHTFELDCLAREIARGARTNFPTYAPCPIRTCPATIRALSAVPGTRVSALIPILPWDREQQRQDLVMALHEIRRQTLSGEMVPRDPWEIPREVDIISRRRNLLKRVFGRHLGIDLAPPVVEEEDISENEEDGYWSPTDVVLNEINRERRALWEQDWTPGGSRRRTPSAPTPLAFEQVEAEINHDGDEQEENSQATQDLPEREDQPMQDAEETELPVASGPIASPLFNASMLEIATSVYDILDWLPGLGQQENRSERPEQQVDNDNLSMQENEEHDTQSEPINAPPEELAEELNQPSNSSEQAEGGHQHLQENSTNQEPNAELTKNQQQPPLDTEEFNKSESEEQSESEDGEQEDEKFDEK